MAKRKTHEDKLREHLENTIERLDEAQETLEHDPVPTSEREKIIEKNEHRQEQITALEKKLNEYDDYE